MRLVTSNMAAGLAVGHRPVPRGKLRGARESRWTGEAFAPTVGALNLQLNF